MKGPLGNESLKIEILEGNKPSFTAVRIKDSRGQSYAPPFLEDHDQPRESGCTGKTPLMMTLPNGGV